MKQVLAVLLLLVATPAIAQTTHNPADCELATILALNAVDGDTINFPTDTCDWDEDYPPAGIHWVGNGDTNSIINITGGQAAAIVHHPRSITGMRFNIVNGNYIVNMASFDFRISHSIFDNQTGGGRTCIDIANSDADHPDGVIDQNEFLNCRILVAPGYLGDNPVGDDFWREDSKIGLTDGVVYVERNTFVRTDGVTVNPIDGNWGGRYVFRFNTVENYRVEAHSLQSSGIRGIRSWEVYENTIHRSAGGPYQSAIFLRAGTGMAFNNTATWDEGHAWSNNIVLDNIRSDEDVGGDAGPCDGNSDYDENQPGLAGYRCRDQIGTGKDGVGAFPANVQAREPAYFWGNNTGADAVIGFNRCFSTYKAAGSCTDIQANRDYYADLGGTPGVVGNGVRASRPGSTTEDFAYWSTDQGGNWNTLNGSANDGCLDIYRDAAWVDCAYTPALFPHVLVDDEEEEEEVIVATPTGQGVGTRLRLRSR